MYRQHLGGHPTVCWHIRQTFTERPPGADSAGAQDAAQRTQQVPPALSRTQSIDARGMNGHPDGVPARGWRPRGSSTEDLAWAQLARRFLGGEGACS